MPEIARLSNIIIHMMYFDTKQHNEPHIHITYNEYEASVSLNGYILSGTLPPKQKNTVIEWINLHYNTLISLWENAKIGKPVNKI